MTVGDIFNQLNMPSYTLRYREDMVKFLDVLDQLIDIYRTETPYFFKKCVQNTPLIIYDKIIELNGYKPKSKYWSSDYIRCIAMSKEIVAAMGLIEKEEYNEYLLRVHHYNNHYEEPISTHFVLTMTPPPEYSD